MSTRARRLRLSVKADTLTTLVWVGTQAARLRQGAGAHSNT